MDECIASDALAALGHPVRLRLFRRLVRAGEPGMSIGAIQRELGVPASTLAHHVGTLVRAGMVRQERQGREVRCRAEFRHMHALVDFLTHACCTQPEAMGDAADAA